MTFTFIRDFWKIAGYKRDAFVNLGIDLPPNYADDLSTKPKVQKAARDAFNKFSPIAPHRRSTNT